MLDISDFVMFFDNCRLKLRRFTKCSPTHAGTKKFVYFVYLLQKSFDLLVEAFNGNWTHDPYSNILVFCLLYWCQLPSSSTLVKLTVKQYKTECRALYKRSKRNIIFSFRILGLKLECSKNDNLLQHEHNLYIYYFAFFTFILLL